MVIIKGISPILVAKVKSLVRSRLRKLGVFGDKGTLVATADLSDGETSDSEIIANNKRT